MKDPGGWKKAAGLDMLFCLGGELVWDSHMSPPKRSCVSSTLVGASQYSLKMLGRRWLGILRFPSTDVSNLCACDPEGAVERSCL